VPANWSEERTGGAAAAHGQNGERLIPVDLHSAIGQNVVGVFVANAKRKGQPKKLEFDPCLLDAGKDGNTVHLRREPKRRG
jgi:hypothetical protein